MDIGIASGPSRRAEDPRQSFALQPLRALAALRRLSENPNNTAEVFTIIEALSGSAPMRVLARFRDDASGRLLLAQRPSLLATLRDRTALSQLPQGSLGRAYLRFLDSEGISADGLVQASVDGRSGELDQQSEFVFVMDRLRDTHDLWHTVTGYQGDVVGEAALLAFNVAQVHNPGVALIVITAMLRLRDAAASKLIAGAFMAGLRAAWLPAVHWEELLSLPLTDVRARLRVAQAPAYTPLRMH